MDFTCTKSKNFHIFKHIMQSLPRKDQTRQHKDSTPTPPNLNVACPQAITLNHKQAYKQNRGMVGKGRQNLRTSIKVRSHLRKSMNRSHANERKHSYQPAFIKTQQETPSKEISSQKPYKNALAYAITQVCGEKGMRKIWINT